MVEAKWLLLQLRRPLNA